MYRIIFIVFLLFCSIKCLWAQGELQQGYQTLGEEEIILTKKGDRFITAGVGVGLSYGNFGAKLQWRATKKFGLSAGIGSRFFPSSIPFLFTDLGDNDSFLRTIGQPFVNKTLTGLSFNAGFDIWNGNVCVGLHYAQLGSWVSLYDNEHKKLHGFIIPIEGHISLGKKIPIAISVGGTMGCLFGKDKFLGQILTPSSPDVEYNFFSGFIIGADLGIIYKFKY